MSEACDLRPTGDYLIVRRIESTTTKGGIVLPSDERKGAAWLAEVVASGDGAYQFGHFVENEVEPGQLVYMPPHADYQLLHAGETLYAVRESHVLAVLA